MPRARLERRVAEIGQAADAMTDKLNEIEAEVREAAKRQWRPPSPLAWQGPARRPSEPTGRPYKRKISRRPARPAGLPPPMVGVPLPAPVSDEF